MARDRFILSIMRTPLLVANWKMNKTIAESLSYLNTLKAHTLPTDRQIVICPPYTALQAIQQSLHGSTILYGAQNMHWDQSGAYTGEISTTMLNELGCTYVIIGHSERRTYFNETDDTVQKKVNAALQAGCIPIVCVGETLEQRQQQRTSTIIETQLEVALAHVQDASRVVIAYEPVWAIGTGETATPEQAQEIHALIRQHVSVETKIIYGGSVHSDNIVSLMEQPDIDGALVGGSSLDPDEFAAIVNY